MKLSLLSILLLASLISSKSPDTAEGFAIVELFTSQGCSSCPAADRLLGEMVDNGNVIALSFHVTYWNYLGWKDPYSKADFTKRQKTYSQKFGLGNIYTPQMVVNGSDEFVGSNRSSLQSSVKKGLSSVPKNQVVIDNVNWNDGIGKLSYSISGDPKGLVLNTAIVERHVTNYVPRGENTGKTLKHDNVVRTFSSTYARRSGTLELDLPEKLDKSKSSIILYTQLDETWEITGAAQQKL